MSEQYNINQELIDKTYDKLKKDAFSSGYYLNPDEEFTKDLVRSLLINEKRYGYMACPCRLATGDKNKDIDIICPCDYRDPDITDYNACYCGLYVSQKVYNGEIKASSIPERRPPLSERIIKSERKNSSEIASLPLPVWRCKVCGYLCARENPPEICPICKVKKDRFERFI